MKAQWIAEEFAPKNVPLANLALLVLIVQTKFVPTMLAWLQDVSTVSTTVLKPTSTVEDLLAQLAPIALTASEIPIVNPLFVTLTKHVPFQLVPTALKTDSNLDWTAEDQAFALAAELDSDAQNRAIALPAFVPAEFASHPRAWMEF